VPRTKPRPAPTSQLTLGAHHERCWECGGAMWVAYHNHRTVHTLDGLVRLTLPVRRCRNPECERYRKSYRPEGEGGYALPHGEFGLDVIALVGALRFAEHRSVPEIRAELVRRGVGISERAVTEQLRRYEELVALRVGDGERLRGLLAEQGSVILALDGLQPDVGHEVLWVLRDCASGEILLARSLLGGGCAELVPLLFGGAGRAARAHPGGDLGRPALHTQRRSFGAARRSPPALPLPLPAGGRTTDI